MTIVRNRNPKYVSFLIIPRKLYGRKFADFWEEVVKNRLHDGFGGARVNDVVAVTYYLDKVDGPPVAFKSEPRIGVEQLLWTREEADELF